MGLLLEGGSWLVERVEAGIHFRILVELEYSIDMCMTQLDPLPSIPFRLPGLLSCIRVWFGVMRHL